MVRAVPLVALLLAATALGLELEYWDYRLLVYVSEGPLYTPGGWVNFTAAVVPGDRLVLNASEPVYLFWVGRPPVSGYLGRLLRLGESPPFERGSARIGFVNVTWFTDPGVVHYYYGSLDFPISLFACKRAQVVLVGYPADWDRPLTAQPEPEACVSWHDVRQVFLGSVTVIGTQRLHYGYATFAFRFERPGRLALIWLGANGTLRAVMAYTDYFSVSLEADYVLYYLFVMPGNGSTSYERQARVVHGALTSWKTGLYTTSPASGARPFCV